MHRFNLARFFKFFSNEWKMNAKQTGLLWGALMLSAGIICILGYTEKNGINLGAWLFLSVIPVFIVAQGFYISIQLGAFTSKVRKTALLLQPLSKAEFLTAKMVSCFVLFPLLYVLYIALVAWFISRYNMTHVEVDYLDSGTIGTFKGWTMLKGIASMLWPAVIAIFWTGAFYFGKHAVVKSALTTLALYVGLTGFCYLWYGLLSGCWDSMSFPLLVYNTRNNATWDVFYAWPGFFEAFLLLGSLVLVVMSVVKYHEKTV